jgi:hypothetical protein
MLGKVFMTKYVDLESSIVNFHINNTPIPNTFIELGDTINFMIKKKMENLQFSNPWSTPIVLQLVGRSTVKPESLVDDVIFYVESWVYPIEFMILQLKSNLGDPMILGRPWKMPTLVAG